MPLRLNLSDFSSSSSSDENDIIVPQAERRRRVVRDRINFDFLQESVFVERFRLSRSAAEKVLNSIGHLIDHRTTKNHALNPRQQLLVALHFFGNGSQYHSIGDMHGIHKSTVCRIVYRVSSSIVTILFPEYVRWPNNCDNIQGGFYHIAGFPRVAGAVDGTLIPITAPRMNENDYVDRHGQHSINAMVVCGANYEFFYASARWPGSVHDNRVLQNSTLYIKWEIDGSKHLFKSKMKICYNNYSITVWFNS